MPHIILCLSRLLCDFKIMFLHFSQVTARHSSMVTILPSPTLSPHKLCAPPGEGGDPGLESLEFRRQSPVQSSLCHHLIMQAAEHTPSLPVPAITTPPPPPPPPPTHTHTHTSPQHTHTHFLPTHVHNTEVTHALTCLGTQSRRLEYLWRRSASSSPRSTQCTLTWRMSSWKHIL